MRKLLAAFAASFITPVVALSGVAHAQGAYTSGTTGYDVSYPNCSAKAPTDGAFGIVGVTGGLGFSQNNCLANQAKWFNNLTLYVNTGYPGSYRGLDYQNSPKTCTSTDLNCLAYNYGYNAGLYALNYANSKNIKSMAWWLDVETMNSWTNDPAQNQQSIQGEHDALSANGITTIGVYSTSAQWNQITGTWKNGWPNWGASTWRTAKQASTYCTGHEFTGGTTYLIQFTGKKFDQNYAC
jgi:hypothetical protein